MPQRTVPYVTNSPTTGDQADPQPAAPADKVAEQFAPEYHIAPAWIDTAGRTRTWALHDPHGTQLAEITT